MKELSIAAGKRFFVRRTVRRPLPESWEEIPDGRRLSVVRELFRQDGIAGRVAALRVMLGLPRAIWLNLTPDQIADLLDRTPWLSADPSPIAMLPFFILKGKVYTLPANNFTNGVCAEFPLADDYLSDFLKKGDTNALLKMCAVLCREENPNFEEVQKRGDLRVPLQSKASIERRARRFAGLPEEIQLAVMLYFIGVKLLVNRLYGEWLFAKPSEEEEISGKKPKSDPLHWWGLFMDAAEGDPTKLEAIHQSNFHNFCTMECRRRKQRLDAEMKRKMESPDFGKSSEQ